MRNRWTGGLPLALVLALAACAPPSTGGGASAEPSLAAPDSGAPLASEEPAESEDEGGGRYDY